jgi:hypothetical protein
MSPDPSGSNARGSVWLASFFLALFASMTAVAATYPRGAATLPVLVGGIGAILSAWELLRTARALRAVADVVDREARPGTLAMFVWLAGAVGGVVLFGVLPGAAVFVAAFLHIREGERPGSAVLAGLTLAAVLHLALERGFGLQLFEGVLFS